MSAICPLCASLTLINTRPEVGSGDPAAIAKAVRSDVANLLRLPCFDTRFKGAGVGALLGEDLETWAPALAWALVHRLGAVVAPEPAVAAVQTVTWLTDWSLRVPLLEAFAGLGLDAGAVRTALVPTYFVPSGTPLFQQLQLFQDNKQRLGLVVDEYGEVQGLVTLEDIIEEIVGEIASNAPALRSRRLRWSVDGRALVDGSTMLRDINRRLGLGLPLDGPKTLNGLLVERQQEIPDAPCCVRFPGVIVEVVQVDEQAIRSARLIRETAAPAT